MTKKSGGQVQPVQPRLDAKSAPVPFSGCRLWYGASVPFGYGVISIQGRQRYAHRAAWEAQHGPIPEGKFVLHRCDTPACINPDHLFLGTLQDNTQDMLAKGRCRAGAPKGDRNPMRLHKGIAAGERNGSAKLTPEQVAQIRARYQRGVTRQVDIARDFGIKQPQVSSILRGESWVK
mgnify:CR=1 FL=1